MRGWGGGGLRVLGAEAVGEAGGDDGVGRGWEADGGGK